MFMRAKKHIVNLIYSQFLNCSCLRGQKKLKHFTYILMQIKVNEKSQARGGRKKEKGKDISS